MSNRSLASAKAARTGNGVQPRVSGGGPRVSIGSAAQFNGRPPTHNVRAPIIRAPSQQPIRQQQQPIMQPRQQEQLTSSLTIPQVISMMTVRISEMECWINKQKEERMEGGEQDEGFTHTEMGAILDRIETLERKVNGYDKLISTNQLSVTNKLKSVASKLDAAVKSNEELVNLVCQRVESIETILQENYKENEEDEDEDEGRDETGDYTGPLDANDDDIFMEEDGEGGKGNKYDDSELN